MININYVIHGRGYLSFMGSDIYHALTFRSFETDIKTELRYCYIHRHFWFCDDTCYKTLIKVPS